VMIGNVVKVVSFQQHIICGLLGTARTKTLHSIDVGTGFFGRIGIVQVVIPQNIVISNEAGEVFGVGDVVVLDETVIGPEFNAHTAISVRSDVDQNISGYSQTLRFRSARIRTNARGDCRRVVNVVIQDLDAGCAGHNQAGNRIRHEAGIGELETVDSNVALIGQIEPADFRL